MFLLDKHSPLCYTVGVPRGNGKELRSMNMLAKVRRLDSDDFQKLMKIVSAENDRRNEVGELVEEINDKLHRLTGLLTGADSLRVLNNLTGEVMSAMEDWDEPDSANDYLAPQINVKLGVLRE